MRYRFATETFTQQEPRVPHSNENCYISAYQKIIYKAKLAISAILVSRGTYW